MKTQAKEVKKVKDSLVVFEGNGFSEPSVDSTGSLSVGAAIGVLEADRKRLVSLVRSGVEVVVIDTAHGHSKQVMDMVKWVRREHPSVEVIAGNVVSSEAALDLVDCGVQGVKVGIGVGSICTTRVVTGVGFPQISAILETSNALRDCDVPVISDGSITSSGDLAKALASGASSVMLGSFFAETIDSPGEVREINGKSFKSYRGMGSAGAMRKKFGSHARYFQFKEGYKYVPEGVEGVVSCKGPVKDAVYGMLGGLKSSMGYFGCKGIEELH